MAGAREPSSRNRSQGPGAVVIGGDYQGLGIVRSIGRSGAPVVVVDDERSISRHSRYASAAERVPPFETERAVVDTLLEVGRRRKLDGWVLFPTRDDVVNAISRHRDELGELFRVPTQGWDVIGWAADKRKTFELAVLLGLPTPMTAWPRTLEEAAELDVSFPVVIKPAFKEQFIRATGAKAWRADSKDELVQLFRRASEIVPDGEIMIQELIPGGGESQLAYCALFKDGNALASMQVRRRRQHPWEFGRASTYVETVENAEIEESSLVLLRHLDYYGLVELEYKLDARTGERKLLDINTRTWGYHTLGAAAGIDFPRLLFRDQIGDDVPVQRARTGVKWLRLLTDLPTGIVDVSARRITLSSYVRSLGAADVEAVWDVHDLRPWFAELALLPYLISKRGF